MTLPRVRESASDYHRVHISAANERAAAKPDACEMPSGEQEPHVALTHVEHARSFGHVEEWAAKIVTLSFVTAR